MALQQMKNNADVGTIHLMHTARVLQNEIFGHETYQFSGTLLNYKQSVPSSLYTFINMILEGPGNENCCTNQAALSISQLIMFNSKKQRRKQQANSEQMFLQMFLLGISLIVKNLCQCTWV